MRRSDKNWKEFEDTSTPFLPEETDESATTVTAELRERLAKLEQQVLAQYTATAAYATLTQQGLDEARAESRADLDRSQATIIGLLDRLRAEMGNRLDALETGRTFTPGGPTGDVTARLAAMEERIGGLMRALEGSVHENMVLRQQIADLQRKVMQQDGWLVSGGGPSDLTLH